jgi:hypothetical protein
MPYGSVAPAKTLPPFSEPIRGSIQSRTSVVFVCLAVTPASVSVRCWANHSRVERDTIIPPQPSTKAEVGFKQDFAAFEGVST